MTSDVDRVRGLLKPFDPAPPHDHRRLDGDAQRRSLEAILASDPAPRAQRRGRTRRYAALAGATLVLALALVAGLAGVWNGSRPFNGQAYAATPAPLRFNTSFVARPARSELRRLARVALAQQAGHGRVRYVETLGWYLDTSIGRGATASKVVVTKRQQWLTARGGGTIVSRRLDGSPQLKVVRATGLAAWNVASLSSDPRTLGTQLAQGHPEAPGPAELVTAIRDVELDGPLRPRVQAAVFRLLASTPGLAYRGYVVDRLGRHGVAVSVDSAMSGLPTRYVLVFSPRTGALMEEDETLTTSAGDLRVRVPAVVAYTSFVMARRVPSAGSSA